jgi:hypothetical protein
MFNERIISAYDALCVKLYGKKIPTMDEMMNTEVKRNVYKQAMLDVESEYVLSEGDPDFFMWVLLLLSCSPKIVEGSEPDGQSTSET